MAFLITNIFACNSTFSFPGSSAGKESTCNAGDPGSIPGSEVPLEEELGYPLQYSWASLVAQMVKNPPGFDPWVGKIPWRRAWQPTPVFLPGESPWTEEPGGLQSTGSQRVRHNWATKHRARHCIQHLLPSIWKMLKICRGNTCQMAWETIVRFLFFLLQKVLLIFVSC